MPFRVVFYGMHALCPSGEKEGGPTGPVFANAHLRLEKLIEEINGSVREPWDLQIDGRLTVYKIMADATRDVLRVQQQVGD